MDELERYQLIGRVFSQLPDSFGGMPVHRLTAGRWNLLRARENAFIFSDAAPDEPAPDPQTYADRRSYLDAMEEWKQRQSELDGENMFAICEFLWVCTAPVAEVCALEGDDAAWRAAVKAFAMEHADISEIIDYTMKFREKTRQLAASMVEIVEDGEEGEDDEPGKTPPSPTGSPPTSTPSEATAPAHTATTSSGSSPSSRASNTSTVPTANPAATSNGHGEPTTIPLPTPFPMPTGAAPPPPSPPCASDG